MSNLSILAILIPKQGWIVCGVYADNNPEEMAAYNLAVKKARAENCSTITHHIPEFCIEKLKQYLINK